MRAFIYCRISKDREGEGLGVERQRDDCERLAEAVGWDVVETFVDNDVSASGGKARPAYQRMLKAIGQGEADAIVAWHADRLYRRPADLEHLITVCEGAKVTIRTVRAGELDLSTPTGRMVARILGSVARQEVEAKSDRWERSRLQRRQNGQPPPSRARLFGYTAVRDQQVAIVEPEAEATRWLATQVLSGAPIARLCRDLSDKGFRTTLDNEWRPNALRNYLRNPRLAGLTRWQGEVVGEGTFPAILDRETWEAVDALLATRVKKTYTGRVSLLNGLVYCGSCNTAMHTGSRTEGTRIYRCPIVPPYKGCGKVSAVAEPVERIVEAYTKELLSRPDMRAALAARSTTSDLATLTTSLDHDATHLRRLEDALTEGGRSVGALTRAIEDVHERMDATRSRIVDLSPAHVDIDSALERWPAVLDRRRALVDLAVARVVVSPSCRRGRFFDTERVRIEHRQS